MDQVGQRHAGCGVGQPRTDGCGEQDVLDRGNQQLEQLEGDNDPFGLAVARFRREGLSATPVVFGSHRKPEGVVLPFELFEQLMPAIEDILLAATIRARLANPAPNVPLDDLINELGFSPSEFE